MSLNINVQVVRLGYGRHLMLFDTDISDTCERGPDGPNGEHTWDENYPYVSDTMYYHFADLQIAKSIKVSRRCIEFKRRKDKSLAVTVHRLLWEVQKCIGWKQFNVIWPPLPPR